MDKNKKFRKDNYHQHNNKPENLDMETPAEEIPVEEVTPEEVEQPTEETDQADEANELDKVKAELAESKKEYLFLMAEFDNFRKRTLKEKAELTRNAGEGVLKGLLPILDDFERGLKATEGATDAASVREGMELIYNKLRNYLEKNGVKEMESTGMDFDPDRHEAISAIPAQDDSMAGKVIDTVEKGYTLNDKVLRHAKVVVAQK